MSKIDLTICLRVYPWIADKQKIFCDDKLTIYKKSLVSLVNACGDLNVKYIIILDTCPSEYQLFTDSTLSVHDYEIISYDNKQWNAKTFKKQMELLINAWSDIVYFAEDDYIYQKNSIQLFLKDFIQDAADFGTLYYSPDYKKFLIHDYMSLNKKYNTTKYGYFASTTMTFFTKKTSLKKYYSRLETYTSWNHDFSMRFTITKYNIFNCTKPIKYFFKDLWSLKLWWYIWWKCNINNFTIPKWALMVSLESWATHIDKEGLDTSIDWKSIRDAI